MPPPLRADGYPLTNTSSPHWRGWLKPESRCLVPANNFAEYSPQPNPETKKKNVVWFALNEDRPLFAFGGLWTEFKGDRGTKSKPTPRNRRFHAGGFRFTPCETAQPPCHEGRQTNPRAGRTKAA